MSHGHDTRAVATQKKDMIVRIAQYVGVHVVGLIAWPTDRCSHKDVGGAAEEREGDVRIGSWRTLPTPQRQEMRPAQQRRHQQ